MLSLQEARSQLFWFRWIGRTLIVVSATILFFCAIKAIYRMWLESANHLEHMIFSIPAKLIATLYALLEDWAPSLASALWNLSPNLDLRNFGVFNSYGFLVTYAFLLLGIYLTGQANRIEIRIAKTMQRVEEIRWDESLKAQIGKGIATMQAQDNLNIQISLLGQKPPWYQSPVGLIAFGIGLPMIVEVLKVMVGLAKLP